ncbi:hypothetical protein CUJ88_43975 (plasmid) [Paraburkholderia hospita]|nr:hypothetical protein CUJ88_43975 [Paraburkholderia hospita]
MHRGANFRANCFSGWVTGDEVYGGDRDLRLWLESRMQSFVLAVAKTSGLQNVFDASLQEDCFWSGPLMSPYRRRR